MTPISNGSRWTVQRRFRRASCNSTCPAGSGRRSKVDIPQCSHDDSSMTVLVRWEWVGPGFRTVNLETHMFFMQMQQNAHGDWEISSPMCQELPGQFMGVIRAGALGEGCYCQGKKLPNRRGGHAIKCQLCPPANDQPAGREKYCGHCQGPHGDLAIGRGKECGQERMLGRGGGAKDPRNILRTHPGSGGMALSTDCTSEPRSQECIE